MSATAQELFQKEIDAIKAEGLFKEERVISSPQAASIAVGDQNVLNFCANNYLGLSHSTRLEEAAKRGIDEYGLGLSSVRFICGTQTIHKELERKVAEFFGMEDAILYISCFDANGGLFETILGPNDAVVSDALNHASIIDGIRLSKAKRFRYENANMESLEQCLKDARAQGAEKLLIATDGVFSMDGNVAPLKEICTLAKQYDALTMVDDCHGTGFLGENGKGSVEACGMLGEVDIITSTLGKALGGACGGFTTASKEIVTLLRQRSRPYLFSNTMPPALVTAAIECLDMIQEDSAPRKQLEENTAYFREEIAKLGFTIKSGNHPIVPVMLGDAKLASTMADDLLEQGIYVIGFSYPVVPKGEARIRVQMSAAHSREDLDKALKAFESVGKKHGAIG